MCFRQNLGVGNTGMCPIPFDLIDLMDFVLFSIQPEISNNSEHGRDQNEAEEGGLGRKGAIATEMAGKQRNSTG